MKQALALGPALLALAWTGIAAGEVVSPRNDGRPGCAAQARLAAANGPMLQNQFQQQRHNGWGTGGGNGPGNGAGNGPGFQHAHGNCGWCPDGSGEPLSIEEEQEILFMREEEKLARDVYLAMFDLWNLPVFENISASELRHMNAMLFLIERYDLIDPVTDDTPGVFTNPDLAALYLQLVTEGSASWLDALMVGAYIEDLDIVDLRQAIEISTHDDVDHVLQNLERASGNHLRAFVQHITAAGGTYEPQFLTPEEFQEIIDAPHSGGNGNGPGGGPGGGRGHGPR